MIAAFLTTELMHLTVSVEGTIARSDNVLARRCCHIHVKIRLKRSIARGYSNKPTKRSYRPAVWRDCNVAEVVVVSCGRPLNTGAVEGKDFPGCCRGVKHQTIRTVDDAGCVVLAFFFEGRNNSGCPVLRLRGVCIEVIVAARF